MTSYDLVRSPWRLSLPASPWRSLAYLGSGALAGLVVMTCLVFTAVVFSFVLVPLWVGVVAPLERRRLRLLGLPALDDPHARLPGATPIGWLRARLKEAATWRETAWCLVLGVIGVFDAILVMGTVVFVGLLVGSPLLAALDLLPAVGLTVEDWWQLPALAGAGLVALLVCCYLWTALAVVQAELARALLSPRPEELESRLVEVVRSRATLADAFEHERRRIERDLHDGAQEHLVALTMTLGLAEIELQEQPAARELILQAHTQAEQALHALRATVRGIHPQVLTDHGIEAAIREVAVRSPLPVFVEVDVPRLPAGVESAAYFVATEALTNVVRHSGSSTATVLGTYRAGQLAITVRDEGRGGADPARGSGLAGMRERAAVFGGTLSLDSPPGGPTLVTVVIPCHIPSRRRDG